MKINNLGFNHLKLNGDFANDLESLNSSILSDAKPTSEKDKPSFFQNFSEKRSKFKFSKLVESAKILSTASTLKEEKAPLQNHSKDAWRTLEKIKLYNSHAPVLNKTKHAVSNLNQGLKKSENNKKLIDVKHRLNGEFTISEQRQERFTRIQKIRVLGGIKKPGN